MSGSGIHMTGGGCPITNETLLELPLRRVRDPLRVVFSEVAKKG
jgi:hypothetical protein